MSQIFFGLDAVIIFKPAGLLNPWELFGLLCLLCDRKHFCEREWSILVEAWERHMFSAGFRFFWKAGWEQPLPPSWAMNISYFRISNRPGGTMIKRLPRVTTHLPALFPKKPCCQSVVICLVKDVMCWNVAAVVWENTKNNFPLEMY